MTIAIMTVMMLVMAISRWIRRLLPAAGDLLLSCSWRGGVGGGAFPCFVAVSVADATFVVVVPLPLSDGA